MAEDNKKSEDENRLFDVSPIQPVDDSVPDLEWVTLMQIKHAWREFNKQCARIMTEAKGKKVPQGTKMDIRLDGNCTIIHSDLSRTLLPFMPLKMLESK